jgi:hypothetical protein
MYRAFYQIDDNDDRFRGPLRNVMQEKLRLITPLHILLADVVEIRRFCLHLCWCDSAHTLLACRFHLNLLSLNYILHTCRFGFELHRLRYN